MASGLGAAIGAYRAVWLCMACAVLYGLHAGWIQPLFIGDAQSLWVARPIVLWIVLVTVFWPTTSSCADRASMFLCMVVLSCLICLAAYGFAIYGRMDGQME